MKGVNPHDEIKGSSPSPGAYFEGTSEYPQAKESKNPPSGLESTNFND
jgi:hypothetical protein